MKNADRRGKVEGRNRMTAELIPGPNRRNKHPTGLAAVAIELAWIIHAPRKNHDRVSIKG
jgi:hypothetical protein